MGIEIACGTYARSRVQNWHSESQETKMGSNELREAINVSKKTMFLASGTHEMGTNLSVLLLVDLILPQLGSNLQLS